MRRPFVAAVVVTILGLGCSSGSSSGSAAPPGITPQALATALVTTPFPTAGFPPGLAPIVVRAGLRGAGKNEPLSQVSVLSRGPLSSLDVFMGDGLAARWANEGVRLFKVPGQANASVPIAFDHAECVKTTTTAPAAVPLIVRCVWLDHNVVGDCNDGDIKTLIPTCVALFGDMRLDLRQIDPQGGY